MKPNDTLPIYATISQTTGQYFNEIEAMLSSQVTIPQMASQFAE